LSKKAALPVFGLLIAVRSNGERASGGFERGGGVGGWPEAVKPSAAIRTLPSMVVQVTHAKEIVRTIEVRFEIMPCPFQAHSSI